LKRLLVVPSGPAPSAADLATFMARAGVDQRWSDEAIEQLTRAAAAAARWLADRPEEAARLVEDPAGAVEAMQRAGLLPAPVDDLLAVLRALGRRADARGEGRLALEPAAVRVRAKPALRGRPRPGSRPGGTRYGQSPRDQAGR
jgi:hypothetical protein